MSKVFTEQPLAGAFIVSESNVGGTGVSRSRDKIVIAATAGILAVGTLLGRVTASREFVAFDPAATDGSENAFGFLFDGVDATTEAQNAVGIVRDAEVNADEIVWPTGVTPAQILAATDALEARGVLIREVGSVSVSSADPIAYSNPATETITI